MTRQKKPALVITFHATSQAMAAEELFRRAGLAWKALPQERDALCTALDTAAVGHNGCFLLEMY